MQVEAKIASGQQPVNSAPTQLVEDRIAVEPGSSIALDIAPSFVSAFTREGADLVIALQNGETLRIVNFYGDPQKPTLLYLTDEEDNLLLANLTQASDGSFTAAYVPQGVPSGFEEAATGGPAGGLPIGAILGGVGAAGAAAAAAGGGGGDSDGASPPAPPAPPIDTTPPAAASNLAISANGSTLTGNAEAGATVGVDTNGDGAVDRTATAGANGQFQVTVDPPLTNGQTVSVVVTDAAGNRSPSASVNAPDTTPPAAATGVEVAADGTSVTGAAQPGTTVRVDTNGDGTPDATGTVGADGRFTIPLNPPLTNGETVTVVIADAAGNGSAPATANAPDLTAPAPATGVTVTPDGTAVTGTAEPGSDVSVDTNGDGTPDATGTVGPDGGFNIPLDPPLTNGEPVTVVVTDPNGNDSTPVIVEAPDTTAPAPATGVTVTLDGTAVTGTADPGNDVSVDTNGDGTPDATGTAGPDGGFNIPINPPLTNGEPVTVVVTDESGNDSAPVTINAPDTTAPAPADDLAISPDGTILTGTAETGATVSVDTDGDGVADQSGTVDANGDFEIVLSDPLTDGEVAVVVVTDPSGNASDPAPAFAPDLVPTPGAPLLAPTNGQVFTGSADAGTTVQLSDAAGNPLGSATAAADGSFSITPPAPLPNGAVVTAIAVNSEGDAGPASSVIVDAAAPAAPLIAASNGEEIAGTAETGSTVTVTSGGMIIGTDVADANGAWSVTPATPLTDGAVVSATATDAVGNVSPPATAVIDASLPSIPTVEATNGTVIEGIADAGNTVIITDGAGNPIGTTVADASGDYSFTPAAPLADGTTVLVRAQDLSGTVSAPASTIVDAAAPAAPTIDASNGTELSGTAEAGATITLTDGAGAPIGTTAADDAGNWTFTPAAPLADGTVVNATATDAVGNTGPAATTTVDAAPPAAPSIAATNGVELTGTAEAGSTITLTDGAGTPIGSTVADADGNWSFTPATPLADDSVVTATATDAVGNVSAPASVTVDGSLPSIPQLEPSNGTAIEGIADPGNLVTLTDGAGNPIGQVTAAADGSFTFTPATPLADGTVVRAVAENAVGIESAPATLVVDAVAPAAPVIAPSDGTEVSGTAEAGALITLTDAGTGGTIGFAIAQPDGSWAFTPGTPIADGTVVSAAASDAAGNESGAATVTVDAVAPAAPTIDPTNGTDVSGTAEPGATITLTDGGGAPIGTTTADGTGNWTITPAAPLADGTVVRATATDATGNVSPPATATVDAVAPAAPTVEAGNGTVITGTAETGALVTLTDGAGTVIGQVTATDGTYSLTPAAPLTDGTTVTAIATDAAGNDSGPASDIVDALAPAAPVFTISGDGALLTGTAEPGSFVELVVDGDTANPITVQADSSGAFSVPLSPPLVGGEPVTATATDAAGNESAPGTAFAPDLSAPALLVPEAADGYLNAAELADGIQTIVDISPSVRVGDTVTVTFAGQNGYVATTTQVVTAADVTAGSVPVTVTPPAGQGPFPEGASTLTAQVNAGATSAPFATTVDTIPPAAPVLSLVGNVLTVSAEPGTELDVLVSVAGVQATVTATADNSGLASVDLLTDLDLDLQLDQLLDATVSVTGTDVAGNTSNVATIALAPSLPPPVTIGDVELAVALLPTPTVGLRGTAENGESVRVDVITPAATVTINPPVDDNGNFVINLLDPQVLLGLGLSVTNLLNLSQPISVRIVGTDEFGNDSEAVGVSLTGQGLSLGLGPITVTGTEGDDVIYANATESETISALGGDDLVLRVAAADNVQAGAGDDTIEIDATNFATVNGGDGFDTLLLSDGIDLDYNGAGVGTLTDIERINLGTGDSGSTLTLLPTEVDVITDADNILQITGEANDTLVVNGAVAAGQQTVEGVVYDVYTFGNTTLLVEDNSVQVVTA